MVIFVLVVVVVVDVVMVVVVLVVVVAAVVLVVGRVKFDGLLVGFSLLISRLNSLTQVKQCLSCRNNFQRILNV